MPGASTGKVYHHFVNAAKEITVNGIMSLNVNCFMTMSVYSGLSKMTHNYYSINVVT
ncbi:hypothetical protein LMANV2_190005 [Leptospira interrogans serovar Manilae]|uniref:Uncharacterized protein n=1 Tax=Leptospira interrogans serovar Manilae TaxID=214675 RepID=A0AAQ1NW52_LEPIR|nr:hypothetical protein LMANV2_190005 [Leptospira interrogans serovar Manilae]